MSNTFGFEKVASKRPLIQRDALNSASKNEVAKTTVSVFNAIQHKRPEHQLIALAAAYTLMLEAARYDAETPLVIAGNLMKDSRHSSGRSHQFDAMKHHIESEIISK